MSDICPIGFHANPEYPRRWAKRVIGGGGTEIRRARWTVIRDKAVPTGSARKIIEGTEA